jgi:hypothetical protein
MIDIQQKGKKHHYCITGKWSSGEGNHGAEEQHFCGEGSNSLAVSMQ